MAETRISEQLVTGASTFLGLGKNRIINGEMLIDQRNAGTLVTPTTGTPVYSADRWSAFDNGTGTFTVQQLSATPPTGFQRYLRFSCTSADATGGEYRFDHYIEGYNVRDFLLGTANAQTFTLSFWVRSNQTGLWGGSVYNNASNRAYIFSYTVNSANTWEYKTITIAGDTTGTWTTDNTIGLGVRFALGLTSSLQSTPGSWISWGPFKYGPTGMNNFMSSNTNTFDITGVQLEIGSSATAFEYRPLAYELSLCERYYEKSYILGTKPGTATDAGKFTIGASSDGSSSVAFYLRFRVQKRASPTLFFWTGSGTLGSIAYGRSGASSTVTVTGGGGTSTNGTNAGTASVGATWVPVQVEGHWAADSDF